MDWNIKARLAERFGSQWKSTGLEKHRKLDWAKNKDGRSVAQFRKGHVSNQRPDTLYKLRAGKIEIRTGGQVTRRLSKWNRFKSAMTGLVYALPLRSFHPTEKVNRAHRHAEYDRDRAVNKLVEHIVNGTADAKSLGQQLTEIGKLNMRLAEVYPNPDGKLSQEDILKDVNDQLDTTMRESIQTAFQAKPDAAAENALELEEAFKSLKLTQHELNNGTPTTDDMRRDQTASVGLKAVNEELSAFKSSVHGVRQVMDHRDPHQVTPSQANALAKFAEQAITAKRGQATAEQQFALKFLMEHVKPPDPSSVGHEEADPDSRAVQEQELGSVADNQSAPSTAGDEHPEQDSLYNQPGVRLLRQMDDQHLSLLGGALKDEENRRTLVAGPHTDVTNLYQEFTSTLAADIDNFIGRVNPAGGGKGIIGGWSKAVIATACTAVKQDGTFLHSDDKLFKHFDSVYKSELPKQGRDYFRGEQGTNGFVIGMIARYGQGKLEAKAKRVGQDLAAKIKAAGDNLEYADIPGMIEGVFAALEADSDDAPHPKLNEFLTKLHDDFQAAADAGNHNLQGAANKMVRASIFLRVVEPELRIAAQRGGLSKKQMRTLDSQVVNVVMTMASGASKQLLEDKLKANTKKFNRTKELEIDQQLEADVKKAQSKGASPEVINDLREQAQAEKNRMDKEAGSAVKEIMNYYVGQYPDANRGAGAARGASQSLEPPHPLASEQDSDAGGSVSEEKEDVDVTETQVPKDENADAVLEAPKPFVPKPGSASQPKPPSLPVIEEEKESAGLDPAIGADSEDRKEDIEPGNLVSPLGASRQPAQHMRKIFESMVDIDLRVELDKAAPDEKLKNPKANRAPNPAERVAAFTGISLDNMPSPQWSDSSKRPGPLDMRAEASRFDPDASELKEAEIESGPSVDLGALGPSSLIGGPDSGAEVRQLSPTGRQFFSHLYDNIVNNRSIRSLSLDMDTMKELAAEDREAAEALASLERIQSLFQEFGNIRDMTEINNWADVDEALKRQADGYRSALRNLEATKPNSMTGLQLEKYAELIDAARGKLPVIV